MAESADGSQVALSTVSGQTHFLKKRSTLKYDPMKSAKAAQKITKLVHQVNIEDLDQDQQSEVPLDDANKSQVVGAGSLKQPSNDRNKYRKANSNSHVIKGSRKSMQSGIPPVSKPEPVSASKGYKSATKIPSISTKNALGRKKSSKSLKII